MDGSLGAAVASMAAGVPDDSGVSGALGASGEMPVGASALASAIGVSSPVLRVRVARRLLLAACCERAARPGRTSTGLSAVEAALSAGATSSAATPGRPAASERPAAWVSIAGVSSGAASRAAGGVASGADRAGETCVPASCAVPVAL